MAVRTAPGTGPRPAGSRDPGRGVLAAVRRRPLAAFFVLAYLISWGYWVPVAAAGGHLSHFPGLLGPMLAAFAVSAVVTGRAGVADLLRRMARWRVPVRWYAAVLVPLAAAAVALAVASAFGGMPALDQLSRMPGLPAAGWFAVLALAFLVNGYGEETGWRGFAWPRLRERHGLAGAALLLTGPWALWHLPTFWLDTGLRGFAPVMVPGFLVGMAAGAVVLGWLYERTGGSVLVVALWHASLNMASATDGTEDVAAAATVAAIFWAVLILRAERRRTAAAAGEGALAGPRGR
jgi:membrane protease YdiL (CAAX protease family)